MITLLSDFGLTDPYVAQMKGVIRSINPRIEVVDISHGIEKHNISMGSFVLETTVSFFPKDTIHVAVVDPGVGGKRLPIVVDCDRGVLVGPDNGLLSTAAHKLGFQSAFRISDGKFASEDTSATFHGRDVFARTAAKISLGSKPKEVGPRLSTIMKLDIPKPEAVSGQISCVVLYVDSFGNIVTNISDVVSKRWGLERSREFSIAAKNRSYDGSLVESYSELLEDQIGLLLGSQGYFEIAIREGSAANMLNVGSLDQLKISFK